MRIPRPRSWPNLLMEKVGYKVVKLSTPKTPLLSDMDHEFEPIHERARAHTMTSMENMYALYKAVRYIHSAQIRGDIVECGVWKGGSMMIAAMTLLSLGDVDRQLWLYDTFAGMTEPTEKDLGPNDYSPHKRWEDTEAGDFNTWCFSPIDEVKTNLFSTGYPQEKTTFVKGKVEETIPDTIPAEIALLRLDTDFYESTYHELQHLFPRLSPNGVLIIDDYGWWRGSRDATDQYFAANDVDILLHRVDSVSRVAVKPQMG